MRKCAYFKGGNRALLKCDAPYSQVICVYVYEKYVSAFVLCTYHNNTFIHYCLLKMSL